MSKAVAGQPYTVVTGDTLSGIAAQSYGNGRKWPIIWKANQTTLRSGNPDLIFPGEIINVPVDPEQQLVENEIARASSADLKGKDRDDFTFEVDGIEIPIQTGTLIRTMDTAADGFGVNIQWDTENEEIYNLLCPYKYQAVKCYLGGKRVFTGTLYKTSPSISESGVQMALEGATGTADIVDSTMRPPFESKKITLKDRAEEIIGPLGIPVIYDFEDTEIFDRVTADPTDTIFDHLSSLAKQRGVLISSTREGELIFYRAATAGTPVGTLEEGRFPVRSLSASFDGRSRFNSYKAIANSPNDKRINAVSKDNLVPKSRFMTFNADDSTAGNISAAADWRRSKQLAEALILEIPVDSWYAPSGDLWEENTLVTLVSKSLHIPDGFDFSIKRVEYNFQEDGTTALLSVVPPQVYTGEMLEEPWLQ